MIQTLKCICVALIIPSLWALKFAYASKTDSVTLEIARGTLKWGAVVNLNAAIAAERLSFL